MRWFTDGDRNTKFFHSYVKGRKRKLQLNEIIDGQVVLYKESKDIGEVIAKVFEQQFKEKTFNYDYTMIDCIHKLITAEQQENMNKTSMEEDVREMVFSLNSDNICELDSYSGNFFQSHWKIIKEAILKIVATFFCGLDLPRFVTNMNLVLIPKTEQVRRSQI
ncbi:hypothetical protein RDI58_001662 [Solanum bulbocastanum]|uniref:Uncharacterized protein n=1 Tax=Solanum bulbocastanum TaxID=147425 RepID=A0AAN8YND2_SOLBU